MRRPKPEDADDKARWQETGLRHRMLTGQWEDDAREYFRGFFADSINDYFDRPDLSRNALKHFSAQLNTVWKNPPTVTTDDNADLESLQLESLWPRQQNTGLFVNAMNESLVRVDITDGQITYRTVTADCVARVMTAPANPSQITHLEELRQRETIDDEGKTKRRWTWETWDLTGDEPRFKIEGVGENGKRIDLTGEYYEDDSYPYVDSDGAPVMPYVLYHKRLGNHTWSAYEGTELVNGTLTVAALWTFWIVGVRDASFPIRVLINGKLNGGTPRIIDGVKQQDEITVSPAIIQTITDTSGSARIDQFMPAIMPEGLGRAIEAFDGGLAVHAGLSPGDVTTGSSGMSGFAILVKDSGKRDMQASLVPAAMASDSLLLATAARLANHYVEGASGLPEEPREYRLGYGLIGETAQERKARTEADTADVAAGFTDPRAAWMARHPGTTIEEAGDAMLEAARFTAAVEAAKDPGVATVATDDDVPEEIPDDAEATTGQIAALAPDVKAADIALNGAQVAAAQGIVTAVADGQLPRATGVNMLVTFFNIPEATAESLMGAVGKSFKPADPAES